MRWSRAQGPGTRKAPWSGPLRRWAVDTVLRDQRRRRSALNRLFACHFAPGSLCLVPFEDHEIFVDPRDDKIGYTLLTGRTWQRHHLRRAWDILLATGNFPSEKVFVDVGANIGAVTLYAALSGLFRQVIAIEPDHHNRRILERNVRHNNLSQSVTILSSAASDRKGEMLLHRDAQNRGAHSLETGFAMSPEGSVNVSVDTLDGLLEGSELKPSDVGFVKIDVEGHEFSVLKGMSRILAATTPVMVETTFDLHSEATNGSILSPNLADVIPSTYTHCVDLEFASTGSAASVSPSAFMPTQLQHEILIY